MTDSVTVLRGGESLWSRQGDYQSTAKSGSMAIDYDAIREANLKEYGTGTRLLALLGTLYSDRTHFVFELLQNAEDAGASQVFFDLHAERLEFYHDGRPFNENDVKGICGVADSTKTEDLTTIGRFGIGFKSVYAYTDSPEIHCGTEHFRIEHYVRPFSCGPKNVPDRRTTRFDFPFQYENGVDPSEEIGQRLRCLELRTLLFLHNIHRIEWNDENGNSGSVERESEPFGTGSRIFLEQEQEDGETLVEDWLVFSRRVYQGDGREGGKVQVAFFLHEEDDECFVAPANQTELFVFFPTEKETHLGFLVQGPFRTTPARDNIPRQDPWNRKLVEEIAQLTVEALELLKNKQLLSVGVLEAMPLAVENFPRDSMFRPLYVSCRQLCLT